MDSERRDDLIRRLPQADGRAMVGGILVSEVVGEGGMGVVYKGLHLRLGIPVAVKVLNPAYDAQAAMFLSEARLAAGVDHPNVVRVYDVNREEGLFYIVQEFVEGEAADELVLRLADEGAFMPEARALEIAADIARGLCAIHAADILHLDIKPSNILIRGRDRLSKITDLGIARRFRAADLLGERPAAERCFGTPGYMSPEVLHNLAVGPATDLYALGLTLYELLASRAAYEEMDTSALILKQLEEVPAPIARIRPGLSPATVAVLEACLETDPSQRPASAQEALERLLEAHRRVEPPAPARDPAAPAEVTSARVACVDDDPALREQMGEILAGAGHAVHAFGTCREALEFLRETPVDVVLMDLRLPGEDGAVACETIRALPANRGVPVVMVSGENDPQAMDRALSMGAADFLNKPVLPADLLGRVRCLARLGQVERERRELETQYVRMAARLRPGKGAEA